MGDDLQLKAFHGQEWYLSSKYLTESNSSWALMKWAVETRGNTGLSYMQIRKGIKTNYNKIVA